MIVNFFAPWCHWCQRLEPVWEKSTATLAQKYPGDDRLFLAKVPTWRVCCDALHGAFVRLYHSIQSSSAISMVGGKLRGDT